MTEPSSRRLTREEEAVKARIHFLPLVEAFELLIMLPPTRAREVYFSLESNKQEELAVLFHGSTKNKSTIPWMAKRYKDEPSKLQMIQQRMGLFGEEKVFDQTRMSA